MPTSAGTKVSNSKDSQVVRENPGPVPSDSLAAESTRQGGGFAANPTPNASSSEKKKDQSQQSQDKNQGERAPTYEQSKHHTVGGGPHGKNITEAKDGDDEWKGARDGTQAAMNAEIGSKDDPSRLATLGMAARNARTTTGGGARGGAQGEGNVFDALNETDA